MNQGSIKIEVLYKDGETSVSVEAHKVSKMDIVTCFGNLSASFMMRFGFSVEELVAAIIACKTIADIHE